MTNRSAEERNYAQNVAQGHYQRPTQGLTGKYDNVRLYWEDQLTRLALRAGALDLAARPALPRVLDLGAGAGEGLELLARISRPGLSLGDSEAFLLPVERLGSYLGLDLSAAMVEQGRRNWASLTTARFEVCDLNETLGSARELGPFDLAFSSYGSLSHLTGESDLFACLARVTGVLAPGGRIVLDLLGRFSPEWPAVAAPEAGAVRTYSMSYLVPETERAEARIERFPCRFWSGAEVSALADRLAAQTGRRIVLEALVDRSILVGRHVDTREFGCTLPPLRDAVCRLFEPHVRTPLGSLGIPASWQPPSGPAADFLAELVEAWNRVVSFTSARLAGDRFPMVEMAGWGDFPPTLQFALLTMDRIVDSVAWIEVGDVRADVIEPQLAFVLRRLERGMGRGLGAGHGLVAVLRFDG